jgi:hypothetical protein
MHERCAALDIGKKDLKACVRTPSPSGRRSRRQEIRTFATTTNAPLALRDRLVAEQVTLVVMEATGDYWRAAFYLLEDELNVSLVNAAHAKGLPGRKTDADAAPPRRSPPACSAAMRPGPMPSNPWSSRPSSGACRSGRGGHPGRGAGRPGRGLEVDRVGGLPADQGGVPGVGGPPPRWGDAGLPVPGRLLPPDAPRLPGETSCLTLVWAVLDRASRGWRGFTMTADGLRLLQDLRRSLLEPPAQLRPRSVTAAQIADSPETVSATA